MSEYDMSLSEHENMVNKAADIRDLIWEGHPAWAEMVGCPYSVLCYAEEYIKQHKLKAQPECEEAFSEMENACKDVSIAVRPKPTVHMIGDYSPGIEPTYEKHYVRVVKYKSENATPLPIDPLEEGGQVCVVKVSEIKPLSLKKSFMLFLADFKARRNS